MQFELVENPDVTYYCDFGNKKFDLCGYTVSGVTTITLYYWTRGNVIVNLKTKSHLNVVRLGKLANKRTRKLSIYFLFNQ